MMNQLKIGKAVIQSALSSVELANSHSITLHNHKFACRCNPVRNGKGNTVGKKLLHIQPQLKG
jgi:hypothetical protein